MKMINNKQDSKAHFLIFLLSFIILCFLFWLIYFRTNIESKEVWVSYLPALNAGFNSLTSVFLVLGFIFIKRGFKKAHIRMMLSAVATSALFLVSYVLYHYFHGDTKYVGEYGVIYFPILISHIFLSMGMVPLVFLTLFHAFRENFDRHRKFARVTFPIWLYVSVTGVLVFFFLN